MALIGFAYCDANNVKKKPLVNLLNIYILYYCKRFLLLHIVLTQSKVLYFLLVLFCCHSLV